MLPIDDDIGGPAHACHAVRTKADGLVEADPDIEQRDRHDQRIDQRCSEQIGNAAFAKEPGDALLESLMRDPDLSLEAHAAGLDPVAPPQPCPMEFDLELALQPRDVSEQIIDTRRHERSCEERYRVGRRSISMTGTFNRLAAVFSHPRIRHPESRSRHPGGLRADRQSLRLGATKSGCACWPRSVPRDPTSASSLFPARGQDHDCGQLHATAVGQVDSTVLRDDGIAGTFPRPHPRHDCQRAGIVSARDRQHRGSRRAHRTGHAGRRRRSPRYCLET